jgi:hypothetical protein
MGNNKGEGVPERGWAIASVHSPNGVTEIDYMDIEAVIPGHLN